ncbi:hypothetical protein CC80DRAFT_270236 [Byssothecium circinans]|uniref:Uncharacterized protein n=1 Tax=Byssothecium circinans TaxID=147558 RepID=A0A6A5TFE8_9PLEO|nr:hypothetical protein CC80DRAFT_270236 [Byssothecium circinans]
MPFLKPDRAAAAFLLDSDLTFDRGLLLGHGVIFVALPFSVPKCTTSSRSTSRSPVRPPVTLFLCWNGPCCLVLFGDRIERACITCTKQRRPCVWVVEVGGMLHFGWYPLEENLRVGKDASNIGYWVRPE